MIAPNIQTIIANESIIVNGIVFNILVEKQKLINLL